MAVSTIVRRGVEVVSQATKGHPSGEIPHFEFTGGWMAWLLVLTVFAFAFVLLSIEYTYGLLVPTLAAVEHPNPELFVRVDAPNNKNATEPNEMEIVTAIPKPITSKLRTTIRHLRARAGRLSRYRGLSMFLTCSFAEAILIAICPVSMNSPLSQFVLNVFSALFVANLQVAWVHIVISEPSPKRFYQRIPSLKSWKKIIPAAVFEYVVVKGAFYATLIAIKLFHGLDELDVVGTDDQTVKAVNSAVGIISIAGFISWLTSIPARAIFIRVAASMLPEEDESIVPFDRTFGGKVTPAIVGGAGVLSISDAWNTFESGAFKRYIKALFKAMAIEFGATLLFSILITAEILGGAISASKK